MLNDLFAPDDLGRLGGSERPGDCKLVV